MQSHIGASFTVPVFGPLCAEIEPSRIRATAIVRKKQLQCGAGELEELRWTLVSGLRGELALDAPGLDEHLRHTVAGQLAIDQPNYPALTIA